MIIDFTEYKYGTKLNMTLSDDKSDIHVSAIVEEIEWSPNRLPFLVHLMLDESEDPTKWPNKSKITLEVKCDEEKEQMFILDCPATLGRKTFRCKAKIHLN
jgi:hypothetical protein